MVIIGDDYDNIEVIIPVVMILVIKKLRISIATVLI